MLESLLSIDQVLVTKRLMDGSASLSYVKRAAKEQWKPMTKINKNVGNAKKSVAAPYLQLKSGHAVIGAHLSRIDRVPDARC